jgi:hypothetical protein
MEKLNDIERGYLKRWQLNTVDLILRNQTANAIAISAILFGIFVIPPWPLLNDFTGVLVFAVLMSIARWLDRGAADGRGMLAAMTPVAIKMGMGLATFDAVAGFFTSGKSIFSDYAAGGDWLATALQVVGGNTLTMINLLLNGSSFATLEFQSPVVILLIFIGAIRSVHPELRLGYLMVSISAFTSILRNLAPTVLIMLAGEFVIRSGNVMGQAIMEQFGQTTMFAAALLYALLIWVLSLVLYQFLREVVEGEKGNTRLVKETGVEIAPNMGAFPHNRIGF